MTAGLILLAELLFSKIEYHIMATAPEINLFVEYKDRSALDRVLKLYRDKLIKVSNMEKYIFKRYYSLDAFFWIDYLYECSRWRS